MINEFAGCTMVVQLANPDQARLVANALLTCHQHHLMVAESRVYMSEQASVDCLPKARVAATKAAFEAAALLPTSSSGPTPFTDNPRSTL